MAQRGTSVRHRPPEHAEAVLHADERRQGKHASTFCWGVGRRITEGITVRAAPASYDRWILQKMMFSVRGSQEVRKHTAWWFLDGVGTIGEWNRKRTRVHSNAKVGQEHTALFHTTTYLISVQYSTPMAT